MRRALAVTAIGLVALLIMQFVAIRRMRLELSSLRAEVSSQARDLRRDEIARAGEWLHAWMQSPEGGHRDGGLCPGGSPDIQAINHLIFGVYLQARANGASESEARGLVVKNLQ